MKRAVKRYRNLSVDIDRAEDRHKFSTLLDKIGVDQPAWSEVGSLDTAVSFAEKIGYPVLPAAVVCAQRRGDGCGDNGKGMSAVSR